ncbi:MAG: hypothetical protein C4542_05240 [Dehalococcoidia bacterium]|nr:MAG: hypothetical protein C4542_05240 [Dehalococcoidia bacterium]
MIKTAPIPALTAKEPADRLEEFYRKIGWDGEMTVDPSKVKVTGDDYQRILEVEREHARKIYTKLSSSDIACGINIFWCNSGPSGSGKTPGMVELHAGWVF